MKMLCIGEVTSRFRIAIFLILGAILTATTTAQPLGPVITIPIEKVPEAYNVISEDGTRKSCGERLYGEWPAYRSYTNRTDYTIHADGVSPSHQFLTVTQGGRFRFYCFFNGIDTPNLEATCPTGIEIGFPDWYVEVRRRGPAASFTNRVLPPIPGEMEFTSTSTDPDLDPIAFEAWTFGDGGTGSGPTLVHRYANPGSFVVGLTVTDSDGLTNRSARTVVVPAPRLTNTVRIISQHSGNRIAPDEVFEVRVTVSATTDGVGDLSNVVFDGPPLQIPTNGFTVVQAPADTSIGTLQPGEKRTYEWKLRAGGLGDFVLRTARTTGRDAIGRTVVGQSVVELGTVTALIIGLEQRPSRIVLGEDNNGDGVVNMADARVELILGITNVATVPITELRTDNVVEPINLVTKLAGAPVALNPVNIFSGDLGSVQPGAGNAVFRTNIYTATNYVYATASVIVRGKAEELPVQTGTSTSVEVRQPGVEITMHALEESGLTEPSIALGTTDLDAPLVPVTASATLNTQPEIGSGLIGDGVTPLLFKLEADTKALTVQNDPLKIRLQIVIKGAGHLGGASLQSRLRILKAGAWTASDTAEMTLSEPKVYAYLMPIASDEIEPPAGQGFLGAELTVLNEDSDTELEHFVFGLRKPPIALVHGYNTDGNWGAGALSIFKASRPDDARAGPFVHVIRYGQETETENLVSQLVGASVNTTWPLEALAPLLQLELFRVMNPMKTEWAFTRHDVVAHSQGGLLTRMLCADKPNHVVGLPFRNEQNFNRGRFHRVITIGSPHNGTRILRYMLTMHEAGIPFGAFTPRLVSEALVFNRVAQKKFDPWGPEIVNLNNQHVHAPWYPDAGARFHLVRTTVNDGQSPTPDHATLAEYALNLSSSLFGIVVIPRGSDGVVDFDSMAATTFDASVGANVFTLPASLNVAHAVPSLFGGTDGGQVDAVAVANHVIGALEQVGIPAQDRTFGSFRPPRPLPFSIRDAIDAAALAQNNLFNVGDLASIDASTVTSPRPEVRAASGYPRTFELNLTTSATRPVGSGGVLWFAELFGTNGVSLDGLTLTTNPTNPSQTTLKVKEGVVGDVVAYALYRSTNGSPVYSTPLRVASFEPTSPPAELLVLPQGTSLPVGDVAPIQLLVRHEDGLWLQRHVKPGEITVTSRQPLTVNVDDPLAWRCVSSGKASVSVTWR